MNPRRPIFFLIAGLAGWATLGVARGAPTRKPPDSDLATAEARRAWVDLAATLAKVETPLAITDLDLPRPFNPRGFSLSSTGSRPATGAPAGPVKAFGDHDILAAIAPRIQPSGTFSLGSDRQLIFGKKRLKAGDHLTVNFEGVDYTIELVGIDRTNFTLRLNHEEITRPIKPGKNP